MVNSQESSLVAAAAAVIIISKRIAMMPITKRQNPMPTPT